ncbi:uncharacterized mitochondrial protein-like protein [Tanacetum coccineum]
MLSLSDDHISLSSFLDEILVDYPPSNDWNLKPNSLSSGTDDGETNQWDNICPVDHERKRKRMISNRDSAKRSRMKKQKHLEDLKNQVSQFKTGVQELMNQVRVHIVSNWSFELVFSIYKTARLAATLCARILLVLVSCIPAMCVHLITINWYQELRVYCGRLVPCLRVSISFHKVVRSNPGDDAKKNDIVKGLLFQSIQEDLVLQIGNLKTWKKMWEAIKTHNLGADRVKEARLQTLITEFENLKMSDNDTIDAYAVKLSGIASNLATLGDVMSKHKLVKKFLTSLPRRFVHIVAALEQVLDLKTTRFEDVVGRLNLMKKESNKKIRKMILKRNCFMLGRIILTGITIQEEGEDVVRTLEVVAVVKMPKRNRNHEVNLNETQEKDVYHGEDELFMTGTSLDLINEFKRRMASQFEMLDLGKLTYYLGIEVSQGNDCVEIKQERYAMKILKEAGIKDCNVTLYPMEKDLKFSKAEDEPEVEATQYRKVVGCLRYLLHTRTTSFRIKYKRGNDMRSVLYSSHNVDIDDDGRSTTRHVFYLGTSPITWCSQKQTTVVLSSCEAEFMTATTAACQAIWLRELLAEVMKNEHVIVEHVSRENQIADPLTKALACIRFKEMRSLLGV